MPVSFRSYNLAVEFYRQTRLIKLPYFLKDQLQRASSSIALNLAEGSAKPTKADRRRFYYIALGSVRECESIIELADIRSLEEPVDKLARHIYNLCKALE